MPVPLVTGERVVEPATGEHALVLADGEETRGAYLLAELELRRRATGLGEHRHPLHAVAVEVLHGALSLRLDGRERRLGPGEQVGIAAGRWHDWGCAGDAGVLVLLEVRPAPRVGALLELLVAAAGDPRRALLVEALEDELEVRGGRRP